MGGVGHASLFTTTSDLARFARMMLQRGELDGVRVFKPETVTLMTSVQSTAGPAKSRCEPSAGSSGARLGHRHAVSHATARLHAASRRAVPHRRLRSHRLDWAETRRWIDSFSRTFVIFLCNRKTSPLQGIPVGASDDHPVVNVSWDDAKAFCEWLCKKGGCTYRLPTDHEWSAAVGIGARESTVGTTPESLSAKIKDEYPWGRQWPPSEGAGNYADEDRRKRFPAEKTIEGYSDGFAGDSPGDELPAKRTGDLRPWR